MRLKRVNYIQGFWDKLSYFGKFVSDAYFTEKLHGCWTHKIKFKLEV